MSDLGGALVLHSLRPSRVVALHRRLAQYLHGAASASAISDVDSRVSAAAVLQTADLARAVGAFCSARELAALSALCVDLHGALAVEAQSLWGRLLFSDFSVEAPQFKEARLLPPPLPPTPPLARAGALPSVVPLPLPTPPPPPPPRPLPAACRAKRIYGLAAASKAALLRGDGSARECVRRLAAVDGVALRRFAAGMGVAARPDGGRRA